MSTKSLYLAFRMKRYFFLTLFFFVGQAFLISTEVNGQSYQFTPNCQQAYHAFLALKIQEGKNILLRELLQNPNNRIPVMLANYEDFLTLTFNEDPVAYKKRFPLFKQRLKILESSDKKSPYHLFCKGMLYFQWFAIQSKYGDFWDAAWDFRRAYLTFKECKSAFPNFRLADPFIGAQQAIISTIPSGYKWISQILGLKGDMKSGMNTLKQFIYSKETLFQDEARLYYIYLKNYLENDPSGALLLIQSLNLDTKSHLLNVFAAANLALNNKDAGSAEKILLGAKRGPEYMPFPMLDFELADAKMKRLDMSAIQYFQAFIKNYKGYFYIKDAHMSLALCYYLLNQNDKAMWYKKRIAQVGKSESDADKQAQKFSVQGRFPNKEVLKARLLGDGGNHQKALEVLNDCDTTQLTNEADRLEWMYRLGRAYDELKQDSEAIQYYNKTIRNGENSSTYFAARAALQAGYIFEKNGQKAKALEYFNKVLDMDDHEFKNSLDQRAKAGINRLKGG